MVVCKCRKATRLYCFVHKVPVCGECICFPEHQICVVKKYSDWVVDGEYDWPPKCSLCNSVLEEGSDQTTRLGCLHLMHTKCLVSHIQSFPTQTAPAGYVCPACSTPLWPPTSIKDTGSRLHAKLKESIVQSGLEKNVFGNHVVPMPTVDTHVPPAFASDPLMRVSEDREINGGKSFDPTKDLSTQSSSFSKEDKYLVEVNSSTIRIDTPEPEIVEIDGPSSLGSQFKSPSPMGPGATTRKGAYYADKQNSETSYYADDEDGSQKKYTRRGSLRHKFLRMLLPFWSSALPTLPVTAPPRKDNANDVPEGRLRHQRSSRMDPRKLLLTLAIMACMGTMAILYYRLAQRSIGENVLEDEAQ
ncbi:zinc finger protein-like 1 homolog isoform X1 [Ananas comosus]|uniref:Zinc finger protein-like 1 homolog isoform X1 n=2 Tax=Ananas comosus TaxID=4615 RepID=A0A6P5FWB4_ANACO|nr:zinc finger protein-like 1 homolog isoform X1 [Ananas comosus]CAD1822639.1 unnamed protein product [Ananas comosus var. bracteatus]